MAVEVVDRLTNVLEEPIYVYHDIVHNRHVVNRFEGNTGGLGAVLAAAALRYLLLQLIGEASTEESSGTSLIHQHNI